MPPVAPSLAEYKKIERMIFVTDFTETTEKRWSLARYLIEQHAAPVIPLYPFDRGDDKAGKVPRIKDWQKRTATTLEELQQWRDKDEASNVGLPLGNLSGIIAIDVDGKEGKEILKELSQVALPLTVRYSTPGGGRRYLYRIPEALKGKKFRKYAKQGQGEHSEVALLGDGQQTVLPYSIHPNGGVYRFIKGHNFKEIEMAEAPQWMIALMTQGTSAKNASVKESTATMQGDLASICSQCPRLEVLRREQAATGLDEEMWFRVISFFVGIEHSDQAMEFSSLSSKHNARSEERINLLVEKNKKWRVYCTTLGCTEEDILQCFGVIRKNKKGEIANSPAFLFSTEMPNKYQAGFTYDSEGNFSRLNCNLFIRSFLRVHRFSCFDGSKFYQYTDDYWKALKKHEVKLLLRRFFDLYEPNCWRSSYQKEYLDVLPLLCVSTETLTPTDGHICLKNGLLDLATYELKPHTPRIFTTTKIPASYDPGDSKAAPQFMKFLDDIFVGDQELIDLTAEMMGYCLTTSTKAGKAFILLGPGANGKSTLIDILIEIVGEDNISTVPLGNLHPGFARSQIVDKVLNISTETETKNFNTGDFKSIVTSDMMMFERKNEDVFSARPFCKIVAAMNQLPRTFDISDGLTRRLIILPFVTSFVDNPICDWQKKIDRDLKKKLQGELDGIFSFAINGLRRLQENNFEFTTSSKTATLLEEYIRNINPYVDYVRTAVSPAKKAQGKVPNKKLVDSFVAFCVTQGWKGYATSPHNKMLTELRNAMQKEGIPFALSSSNGSRCIKGISLKSPKERD